MKRIPTVFLAVLTLLIGNSARCQFVKKHGQLQVSGTQLTDSHGSPVVLRGVSFGWHSLWPRFYNQEAVAWVAKDFEATVVRAAISAELADGSYKNNPRFATEKAIEIIEGAIKSDIYVIVDWHSHNINLKEATAFFTEISKKYAGRPNIIYEIFNEPDEETWPEVKAYSEALIRTIRKYDKENIILVGCPHWDQDIHLPAADPIVGESNLMYTMHFYAATHTKELRDRTDAAIAKGLPVFISESAGMEATGNGPLNHKAWQEYINWMEGKKLSWVVWSVSDKDETCSMLKPSASSTGPWTESDLKESGILTRSYLKTYNR